MTLRWTVMVFLVITAGCSSSGDDERSVRVFAAASLTEVFDGLATDFEATIPGTSVQLVFGGSSSLVAQIGAGAPFDVLVTADEITMARAVEAGDVEQSSVFATNTAVVVTVAEYAESALTDLQELRVAVCAPEVPCGRAAVELLGQLGVDLEPVTFEANVSGVVTKLRLGEVDAAVIYETDLTRTGGGVVVHRQASSVRVSNRYPAAVAAGSDNTGAQAFVDFLSTAEAQERLATAGFGPA